MPESHSDMGVFDRQHNTPNPFVVPRFIGAIAPNARKTA